MAPPTILPPYETTTHAHGYRCAWLLAVALAIQCQASAGNASALGGAEMYTEAKNMIVNSPAGGAVILNGVAVSDLVSAHHTGVGSKPGTGPVELAYASGGGGPGGGGGRGFGDVAR